MIWCEYAGGNINSSDPHENCDSKYGKESRNDREPSLHSIADMIFQFPRRQSERDERQNEKDVPNGPVNPGPVKTLLPVQQVTNPINEQTNGRGSKACLTCGHRTSTTTHPSALSEKKRLQTRVRTACAFHNFHLALMAAAIRIG
ncbi:MAG TPA: hypothetical protein VGF97_00015 [Rhizomicrobium sp.]|jgi:hypothetical protein